MKMSNADHLDPKTGWLVSSINAVALDMAGRIASGMASRLDMDNIQKQRKQIAKTAFILAEAVIEEGKARQDVQKDSA
jgi:hypothetical protein